MKQHRVTSEMINPKDNDPTVPDAYIDPDELARITVMAGIPNFWSANVPEVRESSSPVDGSVGTEKGKYQRDNNITPGSAAWFRLWFSLPFLTGEKPRE
jgi:hypothetical protein